MRIVEEMDEGILMLPAAVVAAATTTEGRRKVFLHILVAVVAISWAQIKK